ncbi:hypothetical protein COO60DRAFT_1643734 [Scenedesmus sp. NREL 46B-D3]|nr:hypothetical protein COO60DRAFT_1643734 [Scenedesmus sp. NREL 46B-D3]
MALFMLALLACSSAAAADRSLLQTTGMDDLSAVTIPQASEAAFALRIATVQATPAGPVFTLAGQLDSASQLLQAMAASQNPINGAELLTQIGQLNVDAPADAAAPVAGTADVAAAPAGGVAAPAPAAAVPAPPNSAGAQGVAVMATAGAALLAALLL